MKKRKGLDSVVTLIPWILLAVIFIALVVFFVTNRFDSIGDLLSRLFPLPG